MLRVVEFLKDGFDTFFEIIRGFGGVVYSLIHVLVKCVQFIVAVVQNMPVVISGAVGVLVIVCVLYKILGREGQD